MIYKWEFLTIINLRRRTKKLSIQQLPTKICASILTNSVGTKWESKVCSSPLIKMQKQVCTEQCRFLSYTYYHHQDHHWLRNFVHPLLSQSNGIPFWVNCLFCCRPSQPARVCPPLKSQEPLQTQQLFDHFIQYLAKQNRKRAGFRINCSWEYWRM